MYKVDGNLRYTFHNIMLTMFRGAQGPLIQWAWRARAQGPPSSSREPPNDYINVHLLRRYHKQNVAYSNGGIECRINS